VLRVDGDSPEVEPRQQDDDRAKRAIDVRVTVEEVQVESQAKREEQLTAGERVRVPIMPKRFKTTFTAILEKLDHRRLMLLLTGSHHHQPRSLIPESITKPSNTIQYP
jgi:hypothetical protein